MKMLIYWLFIIGSASGCQSGQEEQEVTQQDLETQLSAIHSFIDAGSCTEDSRCSYIAYGSKSCGEPQGYLVFSTNIEVKTLKAMVQKYTEDEKAYNEQHKIISDCSVPVPPKTVVCKNGNCVRIR
ncbi:MAG: hypothetical protein WCD31_10115 [Gillisia sp.]